MKYQVEFKILILTGLVFVLSLFPFAYVDGAKFQSGVTIKAPTTNETALPTTNEICNNGIDDDGNGAIDEVTCLPPPAGTCGLQIVSGAPINYGQLTVGQVSNEQKVTIKNVGTAPATVMVKASAWTGGTPPNDTYNAEITRVAVTPGMEFGKKFALHSSEATTLGDVGAGQEADSFWSVYADNHLSGSPHQEVTIDLTC